MNRSLSLLFGLLGWALAPACKEHEPPSKPKPEWVLLAQFEAHDARPVFDGNVEVSVSINNTSSSPLSVDGMDRDARVLLKGADGSVSLLHPLSVGVAKPIRLRPNEQTTAKLLFKPLKGEPSALAVYDDESRVTPAPPKAAP
jgi:hypothetical protein